MSTRSSERRYSGGFSLLEVMVALAILGVAVTALFQLFSLGLRSAAKAENYTKALFHARSIMDEAYSLPELDEGTEPIELPGDFRGSRAVVLKSSSEDERVKLYEISTTVSWPPSGKLTIKGLRSVYEGR